MSYDARVTSLVEAHHKYPWPITTGCTDHLGYLGHATAALWLNRGITDANAQLAAVRIGHVTGKNCGPVDESRKNLWLGYLIRPYGLFGPNGDGRMSKVAADNLLEQMWSYARRFSKVANADGPWIVHDSENHDACSKSFSLLSAQFLKADGRPRVYADDSTPLIQYERWREHWSSWFDERAKRGLLVEVGSPTYAGYTIQALLNIFQFSEDEVLRTKAEMFLDLVFADCALQRIAGVPGGAKCRSYPDQSYDGRGDAMLNFGQLLWGLTPPGRNNHSLALATSGYRPPPVVDALATDPDGRGAFEYVSRRPGVGPSGWVDRQGDAHWAVDPTRSVVNYAWVTPEYVLGCAMLKPKNTHIGPSGQNRWQGIQFATDSGARVYPQATPTSIDRTFDAFLSVQYRNILITRKRGYKEDPTLVYFPNSLDELVEEAGWIFVREGGTFLAVRPVTGTYEWLHAEKNKAPAPGQRFVKLSAVGSPIIFEARRSQFLRFEQFRAGVTNAPRSYADGVLKYRDLTFYDDSRVPLVKDKPVAYGPAETFKSPHFNATWGGPVSVRFGGQSATYDFSDPENPIKEVA